MKLQRCLGCSGKVAVLQLPVDEATPLLSAHGLPPPPPLPAVADGMAAAGGGQRRCNYKRLKQSIRLCFQPATSHRRRLNEDWPLLLQGFKTGDGEAWTRAYVSWTRAYVCQVSKVRTTGL